MMVNENMRVEVARRMRVNREKMEKALLATRHWRDYEEDCVVDWPLHMEERDE